VLGLSCTEPIDVTILAPDAGEAVHGIDTVPVDCHPACNVSYVELLVDSAVEGADSFPPFAFEWDVRALAEGLFCGTDGKLYRLRLGWTADSLFVADTPTSIGEGTGRELDWVRYP